MNFALENIPKPVAQNYKIDADSAVISKGLFGRDRSVDDVRKPLNIEIKYMRDGVLHSYLLDNENITDTDICYGCVSQDHKF